MITLKQHYYLDCLTPSINQTNNINFSSTQIRICFWWRIDLINNDTFEKSYKQKIEKIFD